jgi:hypothetical protein
MTKERICDCGHPDGKHELNIRTHKIRCGVILANGKRCPCRW